LTGQQLLENNIAEKKFHVSNISLPEIIEIIHEKIYASTS
jgi:hypothetical protein